MEDLDLLRVSMTAGVTAPFVPGWSSSHMLIARLESAGLAGHVRLRFSSQHLIWRFRKEPSVVHARLHDGQALRLEVVSQRGRNLAHAPPSVASAMKSSPWDAVVVTRCVW